MTISDCPAPVFPVPACPIAAEVGKLYENLGWAEHDGITHDAARCEDLRPAAAAYVSACRLRVLRHLASGHRLLDVGSGPLQYPEYLAYSERFAVRTCIDLSPRALAEARRKLGERGEYLAGDFLDLDIPEADAAVCLHTLYHIAAERQEAAVRKLLQCLRPGGVAVIVYSNPAYLPSLVLGRVHRMLRRDRGIYFHRFPLRWWRRFEDVAKVEVFPWRTLPSREQRFLGRRALRWLFRLEESFPRFFSRWGCYPMIVLTKALAVRTSGVIAP